MHPQAPSEHPVVSLLRPSSGAQGAGRSGITSREIDRNLSSDLPDTTRSVPRCL